MPYTAGRKSSQREQPDKSATQDQTPAAQAHTYTNPSVSFSEATGALFVDPRRTPDDQKIYTLTGSVDDETMYSLASYVGPGAISLSWERPSLRNMFSGAQPLLKYVTRDGHPKRQDILLIFPKSEENHLLFMALKDKIHAMGLGVKVDYKMIGDALYFPKPPHGWEKRGATGIVLVYKIAGALVKMGYPMQPIMSVINLVTANMITYCQNLTRSKDTSALVDYAHDPAAGAQHLEVVGVPQLVSLALKKTIGQDDKGSRHLHVNSNEPVVLINNFGGLGPDEFGGVTHEVLTQLEQIYHIKPVRVYAGRYMERTADSAMAFSITVLNVVNTNLGGPSMIQLLDEPCEASGWCQVMQKSNWEAPKLELSPTEDLKPAHCGLDVIRDVFKAFLWEGAKIILKNWPDLEKAPECSQGVVEGMLLGFGSFLMAEVDEAPLDAPRDTALHLFELSHYLEKHLPTSPLSSLISIIMSALVIEIRAYAIAHTSADGKLELEETIFADVLNGVRLRTETYTSYQNKFRHPAPITGPLYHFAQEVETKTPEEAARDTDKWTLDPCHYWGDWLDNREARMMAKFLLGVTGAEYVDNEEVEQYLYLLSSDYATQVEEVPKAEASDAADPDEAMETSRVANREDFYNVEVEQSTTEVVPEEVALPPEAAAETKVPDASATSTGPQIEPNEAPVESETLTESTVLVEKEHEPIVAAEPKTNRADAQVDDAADGPKTEAGAAGLYDGRAPRHNSSLQDLIASHVKSVEGKEGGSSSKEQDEDYEIV